MDERFAAVIPAYNAERTLPDVIGRVARWIPQDRIIVVDDGSNDGTAAAATRAGAVVLHHGQNRGKGAAIRTGFARAVELPGVEAIFMLDADGQHDPVDMGAFIDLFEREKADLIIGNRMERTENMPPIRRLTNRLTSAVIGFRCGCMVPDSQNGYRLVSAALVKRLRLVTNRYEIESELIIKARGARGSIRSVPIRTIYADERSAIRPARDAGRFLWLVIRSFFW